MRTSAALAVAAALGLSGCAVLMGEAEDRARTYELRAQLDADRSLAHVTASVRGDRAYLGGWTANYAARYRAEAIAGTVRGVRLVYDSMGTGIYDRSPR